MKIALLIDAENYLEPMSMFDQFFIELNLLGQIKEKIAFGRWHNNKRLKPWKELCICNDIRMVGHKGFTGKNASDKSLIITATKLIQSKRVDTLAIYSRDSGFSLVFPAWKCMGARIIVPTYRGEFIPDADHYIKTIKASQPILTPTTNFGIILNAALINSYSQPK